MRKIRPPRSARPGAKPPETNPRPSARARGLPSESILHSRWAAAYYGQQRAKGCSHHTAVRALAYKWQRIIWRCWQSRSLYQEQLYEAALRKSGSPLVALLDGIELGKSPFKNPVKKI